MQGEFNGGGGQPLLFSAVAVIGIAWLLSKIQCAICGGGGGMGVREKLPLCREK